MAGLRLIIRVVETGSFSKAGADLGLTQPTATKHVAPRSLRSSTSVAFGRRVLTPLVLRFMQRHPGLQIDLGFEDRYVDLAGQGVDVALGMGRLADSSLGARYLGVNPWVPVAAPAPLATSKGSGFMQWLQGQFEGHRWAPDRVRPRA